MFQELSRSFSSSCGSGIFPGTTGGCFSVFGIFVRQFQTDSLTNREQLRGKRDSQQASPKKQSPKKKPLLPSKHTKWYKFRAPSFFLEPVFGHCSIYIRAVFCKEIQNIVFVHCDELNSFIFFFFDLVLAAHYRGCGKREPVWCYLFRLRSW